MKQDNATKGSIFIPVTDMCKSDCKYCFAPKSKWNMSTEEFLDVCREIRLMPDKALRKYVIYGGEPCINPDITRAFVKYLLSEVSKNVEVYSNGMNIELLSELKNMGTKVTINYDGCNKSDISTEFEWNYTIAPENRKDIKQTYWDFRSKKKYMDFKICRFTKPGAVFWDFYSVKELRGNLHWLASNYINDVRNYNENLMQSWIKDSLIRLIALSTGQRIENKCYNNLTWRHGHFEKCPHSCNSALREECQKCKFESVCWFKSGCVTAMPDEKREYVCDVVKAQFEEAAHILHALRTNPVFQLTITSMIQKEFTYGESVQVF